jgi:hypothetical protein
MQALGSAGRQRIRCGGDHVSMTIRVWTLVECNELPMISSVGLFPL